MGEIADSIINGEVCCYCGVYLEPNETVYLQHDDENNPVGPVEMPSDGSPFGVPVCCGDCFDGTYV